MRFGPRIPSFRQRIAARTSWKRYARHSLGLKAPRGWGWVTNPKRAVYNRIYNRTTFPVVPSGRRSGGLAWFIVAGVLFVLAKMFGF